MGNSIKIRALDVDGLVTVKTIISHPMENGSRKIRKTGKRVPRHYIQEVVASWNGKIVMEAFWGPSISRNPYLSFQIPAGKGDLITISWLDNKGRTDSASARVR